MLLHALVSKLDTVAGPAVRVTPAAAVAAFQAADAFPLAIGTRFGALGSNELRACLVCAILFALGAVNGVAQAINLLLFVDVASGTDVGQGI